MGRYTTYVASSAWNMAGEVDGRTKLLPSVAISSILTGSRNGVAADMRAALMNSSAMRSMAFFRWASQNYLLGMPEARITSEQTVAAEPVVQELRQVLGLTADQRIRLVSAEIDMPDPFYWAEAWISVNRPLLTEDDWSVEYLAPSLEITLPTESVTIPAAADLIWGLTGPNGSLRRLLFVTYELETRNPDTGFWTPSPPQLFTYRMGTGNIVFDGLVSTQTTLPEFYPPIPLRLNNNSIDEHNHFQNIAQTYKKATGAKIEDLLEEIENHENIKDMDHVFVVYGVSLNTKDQSGRAYLYEFFSELAQHQRIEVTAAEHLASEQEARLNKAAWDRWLQGNSNTVGSYTNPLYGVAAPEDFLLRITQAVTSLHTRENRLYIEMRDLPFYKVQMKWQGVTETDHVGNARTHAHALGGEDGPLIKRGEYHLAMLRDVGGGLSGLRGLAFTRLGIYHQYEPRRFRVLTVAGLSHDNYVYGNKTVAISARGALKEEEESGFIVPLHLPTLKRLSLKDRAQLASCSQYLVVNSYVRVKKKWWQRGFFKVLIVITVVVISFVMPGAGLGLKVGILGQNAAVGAALGAASGTMMAAVAGAIANAMAAMVFTTMLGKAAVELFGDKWGTIIGAFIGFVSLNMSFGIGTTGGFTIDWGQLMRIDNLMQITNSVTGAYAQWMQADTLEIMADAAQAQEGYEEQMKEIAERSRDILGMTGVTFDPMLISDAAEYLGEPSEAFLSRTLLTGSDLAQMSHALIESFAELSLELPRAP